MPQHVTTTRLLAVVLGLVLMPMPAFAQQDTAMAHDSAMSKDDGMAKGGMAKDGMSGDAMASMMFMGEKATGDYAVVEAGGKRRLELTKDFSVADAPDLHLVLANGATPGDGALDLGKLKRASGAQAIDLPGGKNLDGYSTLVVWSKKERRAVATAEWHPSSGGMMMEHK